MASPALQDKIAFETQEMSLLLAAEAPLRHLKVVQLPWRWQDVLLH
jgi:hypothetical protein